jgi:hypothetical protein
MQDEDRGKIRNREYAQQLKDFSGLRFGKITPTDIDGFMDFGNKVFVFIETKHGDAPLPVGQKLALERLCDASMDAKKASVVLVAHHQTLGDIDVASLPVDLLRMNKKWRKPKKEMTVREAVEQFLQWHLK